MSYLIQPQQIAEALSDIADVKGYKLRPSAPKAGDAWPLLDSIEREEGIFYYSWNVMVFLPQDESNAFDWIYAHLESLVVGLEEPIGLVESIRLANIATAENGTQFGLIINIRS